MHGHFKGEVKGDDSGFYVNGRKIQHFAAMQIKVGAGLACCPAVQRLAASAGISSLLASRAGSCPLVGVSGSHLCTRARHLSARPGRVACLQHACAHRIPCLAQLSRSPAAWPLHRVVACHRSCERVRRTSPGARQAQITCASPLVCSQTRKRRPRTWQPVPKRSACSLLLRARSVRDSTDTAQNGAG